jgi:hypothetical protein
LEEKRFSSATLTELVSNPLQILFDEIQKEAYVEVKGKDEEAVKRVYLNEFDATGVEDSANYISSYLPDLSKYFNKIL